MENVQEFLREVWQVDDDCWLGECSGVEFAGSAVYDWTDAIQCQRDGEVVLIGPDDEYRGLVLCGRCYARHQNA